MFYTKTSLLLFESDEQGYWLQQESATYHTSNETMNFLSEFFGKYIISKGYGPPLCPDLTYLDFFLWDYL